VSEQVTLDEDVRDGLRLGAIESGATQQRGSKRDKFGSG
jgi:hypothetical protein